MKNLHTILFALAISAFAFLLTPLVESMSAYIFVAVGTILMMASQILRQKNVQLEFNQQTAIQQEMQSIKEAIQQSQHAQSTVMAEGLSDINKQLASSTQQNTNTVIALQAEIKLLQEKTHAQLANIQHAVQELNVSVAKASQDNVQAMRELEEKAVEGNQLVENIGVLIVQELKGLESLQNELLNNLPNEIQYVTDAIQNNGQDQLEIIRNIESTIERIVENQENVDNQLTVVLESRTEIIDTVKAEVERSIQAFTTTSNDFTKLWNEAIQKVDTQAQSLEPLAKSIEESNQSMKQANEQLSKHMNNQLKELTAISKELSKNVSELASSKHAERQQALKVQKKIMEKVRGM